MLVPILILLPLLLLAAYLLLRKKQKTAVKISENTDDTFAALLTQHVDFYNKLADTDKRRFETLIADFLAGITIEGVGTVITDLDRVLIASGAVIPIFGFPEWKYRNLTNVILYPDTFDQDFQFEGESRNIMGMVGSGYMNGQMLLSRAALIKGFSAGGRENTAIHEFVHLLDSSDGATDGLPESLIPHTYVVPWLHMIHEEMHKIQTGKSDISPYGLTNEAEFFAVAAEYFFKKPNELAQKHPQLYEMLTEAFMQKSVGN